MTQINQYKTRSANESSSSPKGSADNPYTLEEFNAFEEGTWPGGYVETMGYVGPEVVIEGGSGSEPDSSCSSEPDSEPVENPNDSIPNGGGAPDGGSVLDGGDTPGGSTSKDSSNNNSTGGDSVTKSSDDIDKIVDVINVPVELADAIASAAEDYAGNTQIGTNCKLYYQKSSGKVFRGNQYVSTISLSGLGRAIHKVLGPVGFLVSAYNVKEAYNQEGLDGAIDTAISEFYGAIAAECGVTLGALIGTAICTTAGGTVIVAAVTSILVGNGISAAADYFIEISFDKSIEE